MRPRIHVELTPADRADVATGSRQARHEPIPDRITHRPKHYRNSSARASGRLVRGARFGSHRGKDDVHVEADEFRGKLRGPGHVPLRRTVLDYDVLSLDVAKVPEPLPKGIVIQWNRSGREHAEAGKIPRLLRFGCERRDHK